MARLTSKPTSLLVQSPSVTHTSFGSGGETGSLAGNTWTPGRDAQGRVNQVSWDLVPKGRWVAVAGTRLDGLDAQVKAVMPTWRDHGTGSWSGLSDGWSGFAVDEIHSRVWLMGGGHNDSSNNGIYRFDAFRMAWAIEDLPSDPTPWSATYKKADGGFTNCGESTWQMSLKQKAGTLQPVNDWYHDELFWDRKPSARHTYSSMVYVPDSNELVMMCRRLWRYSLNEKRWVYKRLIRDTTDLWMDGENMVAIYDEARREVLVSSAGSSGIYRATGYSLADERWTAWGSPWNLYGHIADVRVGRRVVIVQPPKKAAGYGGNTGVWWSYDLDRRSVTSTGQMQLRDGLTQDQFGPDSWFYDGAALTYLPGRNRYWLYTLMANGGMELIEIDPTSSPWTARRATVPGAVPVPNRNLERKMIYMPALGAVVLCATATQPMYVFRE